jgi:hypothetical protein
MMSGYTFTPISPIVSVTSALYPTMTVTIGPGRPRRTLHVILDELIEVLSR